MKNLVRSIILILGWLALCNPNSAQCGLADLQNTLGITYFSFVNGPGLQEDTLNYSPNHLGLPNNDGINAQNHVSLRWKFSDNLALDFQTRFYIIFNNSTDAKNFSAFRWESPRIGLSGTLLKGDDWALKGAINTDFPHFLPAPLSGYGVQQRKALFNPGMFAGFSYEPRDSRWSIFSVVMPRFFFYSDRTVAEPQMYTAGSTPLNKPEVIIAIMPTVNYKLASKWKLSLGTTLDYRKHIISEWNPFRASLITNGEDPAWRLKEVPIALGVTHEFSETLKIFPFITAYPIAAQRINANTGEMATFWESASVGMWLSGTLF